MKTRNKCYSTCPSCGCKCEVRGMDNGIGSYEFWGFRGYDSNIVPVSMCCEAEIEDDIEEDCDDI